jgi:hypothetical protein
MFWVPVNGIRDKQDIGREGTMPDVGCRGVPVFTGSRQLMAGLDAPKHRPSYITNSTFLLSYSSSFFNIHYCRFNQHRYRKGLK